MILTAEQRAAAETREPRVAVVAGAGTGKTRVLTERYRILVLERGIAPRRILALTFTEKAAREMKERIRKELADRGRRDLARATEFAPISTIHSFLARILRERALDAGLDPRFAIADEMTADLLLEEALVATVDALPEESRSALVDVAGGEDWLRSLYLAARATPFAMGELRAADLDEAAFRARLGRFLDAAGRERASGKTGERLERLRALAPALLELDPSMAPDLREAVKGGVARAQAELFREGREIATGYEALEFRESAQRAGAAVAALLVRLDAEFTASKREEGLLDFADLEREGLRLLRLPVGQEIAGGYDELLVDEYQDTSRIQEAILGEIARRARPFGVGDAKQSIYRFRYADASVFSEFRSGASRFELSGSFRSRPEVVAFTNDLFRTLFRGSEVEAQDLRAEAAFRPKGPPSVELIAPAGEGAADGRRREARALAQRLRDLVEGEPLPRTRADRPEGPLRYGDCALLLRATTHLSVYERALADAGVPYVVVKGRGYYAAREVVDLAQLLLLLGDPHDRYRAVAVLTSLFCGVPEGDLVRIPKEACLPLFALDGERPPLLPQGRWERLRAFAGRFLRWRALAQVRDTGDLVEAILEETRVHDLMLLEPDGRRRHANLRKAVRRARGGHEDTVSYARALLDFRERERRESEAPIAAESDDAVKVMTVHASKGLEFPLVAVADLTALRRGGGPGPILHPDGRFGFRLRGDDESIEPPGFHEIKEWNGAQEENERLRLLYVAFTRAEEHLILSGAIYTRGAAFPGNLAEAPPDGVLRVDPQPLIARRPARRDAAKVRAALRRSAPLPPELPRDRDGARALLDRLDALRPPPRDDAPYVAAAADLLEFDRCPRRYRLKRMLGIEVEAEPEGEPEPFSEERSRRTLGTAFHEILREGGPGGVPDDATIRAHIPSATRAELEKLRSWSLWLSEQPLTKQLHGTPQHREMPFLARLGGMAVRGIIDLYAPALPLLLDYKTSRRVEPSEYRAPMAIYLGAIRALGFPAPDRALLVYVDAEQVVEVPAEPVEPLIGRFLRAHREEGGFRPAPGPPCRHCEFRDVCLADAVKIPE